MQLLTVFGKAFTVVVFWFEYSNPSQLAVKEIGAAIISAFQQYVSVHSSSACMKKALYNLAWQPTQE